MKIFKNKNELNFKEFIFPGGEVSIKLDINNLKFKYDDHDVTIFANIRNSHDFLAIALGVDALRRFQKNEINLFLPYIPYARQDRACVAGESFSLKVFANLLNSLNFKKVIVVDPHSHVAEACINNVEVITQLDIIKKWELFKQRIFKGITFISPDAGANKKTSDLTSYFQHTEFIRADKLRDLNNGNIKEMIVYADNLKGKDIIIPDDICDGGRTFIELAKVLKTKNANKVILFVTHGIFSQGFAPLYQYIDEIWTTNSFRNDFNNEKVNVFNLENI